MADFVQIAKVFEDRVDGIDYYETRATIKLKSELQETLENETRQLLFLIGVPGSGKSVFLHQLPKILRDYEVIGFNTPFFEPVDFVKTLIKRKCQTIKGHSLEELIQKAIDLYSQSEGIVTIDEAQLLSKEMVELLRILADSKAFWFLMAMHEHESRKILQEPQFSSRLHKVLRMEPLESVEVVEYISKELLKIGAYAFEKEISSRLGRYLYKLSHGNFRDLKKILNKMFLLMDCAVKSDNKKYQHPSKCLVTMAAIDGGILAV